MQILLHMYEHRDTSPEWNQLPPTRSAASNCPAKESDWNGQCRLGLTLSQRILPACRVQSLVSSVWRFLHIFYFFLDHRFKVCFSKWQFWWLLQNFCLFKQSPIGCLGSCCFLTTVTILFTSLSFPSFHTPLNNLAFLCRLSVLCRTPVCAQEPALPPEQCFCSEVHPWLNTFPLPPASSNHPRSPLK